jgi:hypothetical protein
MGMSNNFTSIKAAQNQKAVWSVIIAKWEGHRKKLDPGYNTQKERKNLVAAWN